jgi:hypothetical protein
MANNFQNIGTPGDMDDVTNWSDAVLPSGEDVSFLDPPSTGTCNCGNAQFNADPSGGIFNASGIYDFINRTIQGGTYNGGSVSLYSGNQIISGTFTIPVSFGIFSSNVGGTVGSGSSFDEASLNGSIVTGDATFNVGKQNFPAYDSGNFGTVQGDAIFTAIGITGPGNSGTVNGNAVFNFCSNIATVNQDATFNDQSTNDGTVDQDATFNTDSTNFGTVSGNATFNENSVNDTTGIITGNATFNDDSSFANIGGFIITPWIVSGSDLVSDKTGGNTIKFIDANVSSGGGGAMIVSHLGL